MTKHRWLILFRHCILMLISLILLGSPSVWCFDPRHVMGEATEGLMQDYFTSNGWTSIPGQVGRQGIDGLFVKMDKSGVIEDVLFVESKHNTSNLGTNLVCGIRQMSQDWLKCKIDDLIRNSSKDGTSQEQTRQYEQIRKHVDTNNYRGRLWRADLHEGKLSIDIQDVKSTGTDLHTERLSGGNRYKIQNDDIDLKNPKNPFQEKIANNYFRNLDETLKNQGVPDSNRQKLMQEFRSHPETIQSKIQYHQSQNFNQTVNAAPHASKQPQRLIPTSVSISSKTKVLEKQVQKNVVKKISKSFVNNTKTGLAVSASSSWGGPLAMAAGFIGGVAIGMASDYLLDTAVDSAYAAFSSTDNGTANENETQNTAMRESSRDTAQMVNQQVQFVQNRMEKEFKILGNDLQIKHEAQMSAIQGNLDQILQVKLKTAQIDQKVDIISQNMLALGTQMQESFNTIAQMNQTLERMSQKIDAIYDKIDASIKADFDNGCEAVDLYEQTHDVWHLQIALGHFRNFINTFQRTINITEDKELLQLARYFRLTVLNALFLETQNIGYAKSARDSFIEMTNSSENLEAATTAYLCISDVDLDGSAGKRLYAIYMPEILGKLRSGALDEAIQRAETLSLLTDIKEADQLKNAVADFIKTGQDKTGLIALKDPDYLMLTQYINQQKVVQDDTAWICIRYITSGRASSDDYIQVLNRYRSAALTRFTIRQLIKKNYYNDALKILGEHPVQDDTFRIKAYLLLYFEIGSPKLAHLMDLVQNDKTYSNEAKEFVAKLKRS